MLHVDVVKYNAMHDLPRNLMMQRLATLIEAGLPNSTTNKVWHRHPVWFDDGNPIVGYAAAKVGVRVLFWSGQSFSEPTLKPEGSFRAAEIRYQSVEEIDGQVFSRWLEKALTIQWDYKNIVKRKGQLERLK